MPQAYFVRAESTLDKLVDSVTYAKGNGASPVEYFLLGKIQLPDNEYEHYIANLVHPYNFTRPFSSLMVPNEIGLWNCLQIHSKHCQYNIIIYSAGHTFPLYASVNNEFVE